MIHFDHTIVAATDKSVAALFYADILGLAPPKSWGPFTSVELDGDVTLDFAEPGVAFPMQHYAFRVDEAAFDAIMARLQARGIPTWADPHQRTPGINRNDGGRGAYFLDPSGHGLEILTRRYGSA